MRPIRRPPRGWSRATCGFDHVSYFAGEFFRFPRGGSVADRHEFHTVGRAQVSQFGYGFLPAVLGLVWVDDRGGNILTGGIHDSYFHTVAESRVKANCGALTSGSCKENVAEVGGKHIECAFLCFFFQTHAHIQSGGHIQFGAPTPAHSLSQPARSVGVQENRSAIKPS